MLTTEQIKELAGVVGEESAKKTAAEVAAAEKRINDKTTEVTKGLVSKEDFDKFKSEELAKINEKLAEIDKLTGAIKDQGTKLDDLTKQTSAQPKSFDQFIEDTVFPQLKTLKDQSKPLIITSGEMKAAGIQSIAGSIEAQSNVPSSPYLPGIGTDLEIFDILRNPNFILNRVDVGRTNQSRLAWANETQYLGSPAEVSEGGEKPQIEHRFKVEMSQYKKMAAWFKITEELEEDAPQLATRLRRMLQEDVIRGFDDAIQAAVIAAAQPYAGGEGLNGAIEDANYWDAIFAMMAQVMVNHFPNVNTVALHPFTSVAVQADKNTYGYWEPPFRERIQNALVEANKVAAWKALVGDLTQYKVDIYKEFTIKVGWVNDDFIKNQFVVLGEIKYHRYISDARKQAIVYHDIRTVKTSLDSAAS